jgi:haloacetate dehalogenase
MAPTHKTTTGGERSDTAVPFEGFGLEQMVTTAGSTIRFRVGGDGPPLLLLHGCPQTHVMWHKVAITLSRSFTVVASDLRGYGDSSKPRGATDHSNYSFRAMAADQLEVMAALGFGRFLAAGHDRGARVIHRMALDHPGALEKVVMLDILPTTVLYAEADAQFATAYWEWFFFIQAADFPERLLSANPEAFLRHEIGGLLDNGTIPPTVWQEYRRVLSSENAMHAMCEDYRAGASIDLEHDKADAGRLVNCPMQVLWGARNSVWARFDMIRVWRGFARHVEGRAIDAGHYLVEEAPRETLEAMLPFLTASG